jgi:hypothetical protein
LIFIATFYTQVLWNLSGKGTEFTSKQWCIMLDMLVITDVHPGYHPEEKTSQSRGFFYG